MKDLALWYSSEAKGARCNRQRAPLMRSTGRALLTIRLSSWMSDWHVFVPAEQSQILVPGSSHAVLELFLPCANPGSIVLLGYLDASVTEQNRHLIERYSGEEHFHGKRVAKHLRMAALRRAVSPSDVSQFE